MLFATSSVFDGLPWLGLLPSSIQFMAELAGLSSGKFSLLVFTMSDSCSYSDLLSTSSLVTWSRQEICGVVGRHFCWKTSSLGQMLTVLFQVSHACVVAGTTMDMRRWSSVVQLKEWLTFSDYTRYRRHLSCLPKPCSHVNFHV